MGKPTRLASHGTFFISTQTWNRRRLFQSPANATLFLETLQHYRAQGHYRLHAFVVMPDHIHLLLTPETSLERAVGLIKGGFAHRLASPHPVWQHSFTDHRIRDRTDFLTHRDYIHGNPVRARLCQLPTDYPFSSARTPESQHHPVVYSPHEPRPRPPHRTAHPA